MYIQTIRWIALPVVLLLSAPSVWAQRRLPLPNIRRPVYRIHTVRYPSLRRLPAKIAQQPVVLPERNPYFNRIILSKINIPKTKITSPKAVIYTLAFRGQKIGILNEGESIVMGAAYNRDGMMVSSMPLTMKDGSSVPLDQLEKVLIGYDIEKVLLFVRQPNRTSRFIEYTVPPAVIK